MADDELGRQGYDKFYDFNSCLEMCMKRFIPILILTVSIFLAACAPTQKDSTSITSAPDLTQTDSQGKASSPNTDTNDLARTDSQGSVIVKITPLNLEKPGDALKFDVAMDTHSVDLSMDLATLATLTTDTGITVRASLWDAPRGGHHATGRLSFPSTQDGKSILNGAKQLTITLINVDVPERTFVWDIDTK
jgi:hypothetical protein